jgi:phosphocarrier protein FPr
MVGIVVVSHSRALAYAAVELATEMVHDRPVTIEVAAGLDDATFGTDAAAIAAAITRADTGDGVVVLMDLGSAVLSAELALELLEDGRERVLLCPAPLVEGLVAAAVTAATGADRREIAAEAAAALAGKQDHLGTGTDAIALAAKQDHLGTGTGATAALAGKQPHEDMPAKASAERTGTADHLGAHPTATVERGGPEADPGGSRAETWATFVVTNPHGLHARPAARLVAAVRAFDARVEMRNRSTGSPWIPASSLSRVATLGALRGHEIEVRASGSQAQEAADRVVTLASRAVEETAIEPEPLQPAKDSDATGQPASPGIGIGPAWFAHRIPLDIPDVPAQAPEVEWGRIEEALAAVRGDIQRLRDAGGPAADIFDAHLMLLDDPDLLGDVRVRIEHHSPAPQAWTEATSRLAGEFEALADPYLKARAADVRAVGQQVLRALLGFPQPVTRRGGVLIAPDLTPAEAAQLDPDRVKGVLTAFGSPTSHAAILVRARGIPAVVAGFALPDDRIHAPDESYRIASLDMGLKAARALYEELASLR